MSCHGVNIGINIKHFKLVVVVRVESLNTNSGTLEECRWPVKE